MAFIQKHGRIMGVSLKQTNKELILVQDDVRSMKVVKSLLEQLVAALN
jgi:hypothetical protein